MKDIDRREFLKIAGAGIGAAGLGTIPGCSGNKSQTLETAGHDGRMTYRKNPTTSDKVSLLGYGCMRWPTSENSGSRNDGNDIDQEMVNKLVDYAIEHGVNYFDTSPVYCKGYSEKATGIALSRHPREKYYIATKLSNFDKSAWGFEKSVEMYRNSLRNLQVDYIDYMLLHGVGMGGMDQLKARFIDNGLLDFLLNERKEGRIRNLGFSYHGDVKVYDWLLDHHDIYQWDFAQIQLNYIDWEHSKQLNPRNTNAEYLYVELVKRGIPAVVMEPLLGGRLAKVPENIANRLQDRDPSRSIASWAFRFAGSLPGVLTVLSGMTYMEHLQDNLKSYSPLQPLTEDDNRFLFETADLMMNYPTVPCNDCKYCMPCPYGIDIPAILLHYNKCVNDGNIAVKGSENYRKARRAYLVSYDRTIEKVRQADHCIGCKQCIPHCPQGIKIPHELHKIGHYIEQLKKDSI